MQWLQLRYKNTYKCLHFVISKVNFYIPQSGTFQVVSNDSISISQLVHMVMSDWSEEHWLMRDEWRCARVDSMELCVMIFGDLQMLVWCAGSLATQDTVSLTHKREIRKNSI